MNQDSVLYRMLTSVKVWTSIIGLLLTAGASLLAKFGFEVSDATTTQIAITISGIFAVLLGAQAAAGAGKEKAIEERKTAVAVAAIANGAPPDEAIAAGERSARPSKAPPMGQPST